EEHVTQRGVKLGKSARPPAAFKLPACGQVIQVCVQLCDERREPFTAEGDRLLNRDLPAICYWLFRERCGKGLHERCKDVQTPGRADAAIRQVEHGTQRADGV